MTPGQLLNDSAAGNAINHLQLTFNSSPLAVAAQPVLFTEAAHSQSLCLPFELSFPDAVHKFTAAQRESCMRTAVEIIISHLFPNYTSFESFVLGICFYCYCVFTQKRLG